MKQNTDPKITALHGSQMLGTLLGNMKDLKSVLEGLVSKPLKKVEEKNYRVTGFKVSQHADPIKTSKDRKMFVFFPTENKEFTFNEGDFTKSLKIKLQVAEVDLYERKSTIFAQHVWVGYQCRYVNSLGRGYLIEHIFQGVVAADWQPTLAEQDPKFTNVQKSKEQSVCGSSAYGWEGIDD